jgi:hypothetical protein
MDSVPVVILRYCTFSLSMKRRFSNVDQCGGYSRNSSAYPFGGIPLAEGRH